MLYYLILLFTIVPLIELAILIQTGRIIGLLNTIAIVIITGITGALLAKYQGIATLKKVQQSLDCGIMPGEEMINGIIILSGGLMFLTPGFLTDGLGFIFLIPYTRRILKQWLRRKFEKRIRGRI